MFEMDIKTLMRAVIRKYFCSYGQGRRRDARSPDEAIHFAFDVRMSDYQQTISVKRAAGLHFVYWCPPTTSYISVFSAVTDSPFESYKKISQWKHEITHDSCWTDITADTDLYFRFAKELNEERAKEGLVEKPPVGFSTYVGFPALEEQIYTWIPVQVQRDPADMNNYRRILTIK